ncbi:hypothetical protein B0H13DRAFT_1933109 [Mycena leptocephala]|nr:hypothetical protein B0H13DRAFT_1933109 [Mycena leptocephala]
MIKVHLIGLIDTSFLPMQGIFDFLAIAVMSSLSLCFFNRGNLADVAQLARKARALLSIFLDRGQAPIVESTDRSSFLVMEFLDQKVEESSNQNQPKRCVAGGGIHLPKGGQGIHGLNGSLLVVESSNQKGGLSVVKFTLEFVRMKAAAARSELKARIHGLNGFLLVVESSNQNGSSLVVESTDQKAVKLVVEFFN